MYGIKLVYLIHYITNIIEQMEYAIFSYGLVMMIIIFILYDAALVATIIVILSAVFKTGIVICT